MPAVNTDHLWKKYRAIFERAEAKRAELKNDTPEIEARRIESEHGRIVDDLELVREQLMTGLADASDAIATGTSSIGAPGNDDPTKHPTARAIEGAIYSRMTGKAPEGASREFMGQSMLQMGAAILELRGVRASWLGKDRLANEIMRRDFVADHTTSDFATLLTSAGNRVLMESYQAAATPLKAIARPRTASDFRSITMVRLSEAPRLEKVGESGEIKHGSRAEAKEAFKISTFAKIFGLSRNAIINDDLGAFADVSQAWGKAAAETEASELVALLTANSGDGANMDDGDPLFTTGRGNKAASGGALAITTLSDARQALREMKGLDGVTPINAAPRHLVVGSALETEGEQVLAAIYAATIETANPFTNRLTLQVEPRLAGNSWRVFADPAVLPVLTYAYLSGFEGPQFAQREGFDTLGMEFRCIIDFGCGLQDWRGGYLNPGA